MCYDLDETVELFSMDDFEETLNEMEPMINLYGIEYPFGTTLRKMDYHHFYEQYINYCDNISKYGL